jgi:hypothetical protein
MGQNIGGFDRAVRICIGSLMVAIALFSSFELAIWGWIGALPLASGIVRRCPAYSLLGISTYRND